MDADRIKQESPPNQDDPTAAKTEEHVAQEAPPLSKSESTSSPSPLNLELAYIMNHAVVFAVNVDAWPSYSDRLQVNKDSYRSTPLPNWSNQARVFHSRVVPKARVLWLYLSSSEEPSLAAFAVEIVTPNPQAEDLPEAQNKAQEAYNECLSEIGVGIRSGVISGVSHSVGNKKPTLLNVISSLLSAEITTAEQREQINQVVFSFLQNEIPLSRLYAQFSHIVGYSTLRAVVKAISDSDDDQPPLPPSHNIVLKPKAQQLPSPRTLETARSLSSGLPAPAYFFANELERLAFFSTDDERRPQFLQEVSQKYQYPFWVDPPVHESIPFRSGHHSIENGGVWLQIGGLLEEQSSSLFSLTQPSPGLNGWEQLTIINQFDMKSHTQPLTGSVPAETYGASLVLAGDFPALDIQSECLIAFGGVNSLSLLETANSISLTDLQQKNAASVEFSDALAVLDLQSLKWTSVPCVGEIKPSPRAFHTCHLILQEIPNSKNECEMIGMFVTGGIGPNKDNVIVPLSDAWYLSLATGKWRALPLGGQPEPHWAASLSIAGTNTFLLHGGASVDSVSGPRDSLKLLTFDADKGRIRGKIMSLPIVHDEERPISTKRSFHWSSVLKVEPTSIRQYELGMSLSPNDASLRNVLMLAGGQTETKDVTENVTLILLNVTADGITAAAPIGKTVPQLRPFSPIEKNPIPRAFGTINFFFCFSPVPTTRPKPAIPALLYHGGVPIKSTEAFNCKVSSQDQHSLSTWILSIPAVDPFELSWYSRDEQHVCRSKRRREEMETQTSMDEVDEEALTDDGLCLQLLQKRNKYTSDISGPELARLFSEHLRHNAPWMAGLNFAPGIFQALGSIQIWPFTSVGNLLENALVLGTRCTAVAIDVGLSKSDGTLYFAVTDNGRGMTFTTVNKALKRFAHWDGPMERRDTMRSRPTLRYGMGMKFAFARLGKGAVLMTRTRGMIGLSLLSQSLLFHAGAQCLSTPTCFWKLPSKDTIFPSLEHWRNQQKIQQFSPFKSAPALAEQINTLGHTTGTRVVFYDCQPMYPLSLSLDPVDGLLRLSSAPNASIYTGCSSTEIPMTSAYREATSDLMSLNTKIDRHELESLTEGAGLPSGMNCEFECKSAMKLCSYGAANASLMVVPDETLSVSGDETAGSSLINRLETRARDITDIIPEFPCFTTARDSIDFNLATYLFWNYLFSPAVLYCSAYRLQPKGHPKTPDKPDPFHNSLFRWLKQRLHGMVELDYLFSPEDAQAEGFGLLGFLNPLDKLVMTESETDVSSDGPRVYETGILLYYKERLIRRMFVPFPANAQLLDTYGRGKYPASHFKSQPIFMFPCTGIINVPEWLFPNASRDDFVANRSPIFDHFCFKTKKLVAEYLRVCLNEEDRIGWIRHRGEEFLRDVGRSRPLSPMLHLALFKSTSGSTEQALKDKTEAPAKEEEMPPAETV